MKSGISRKKINPDEVDELKRQLEEAHETIEAIRTGQVDALVVADGKTHQLYTLKTADQGYRFFVEKMSEGALTLDRKGNILYCNSAFKTLVGQPDVNFIGLPFQLFILPKDKNKFAELFEQSWMADCYGEIEVMAAHGPGITTKMSLNTLALSEGILLSVIVTDLTVQKMTQAKLVEQYIQLEAINGALERSNRDLQQFASIASHDLQEPLRKIKIFSQFLKDQQPALSCKPEMYINKIISSVSRMEILIVNLLKYSQLSAAEDVFEMIDLAGVVEKVLDDFEVVIQEKQASFKICDLPLMQANDSQMYQLMQNLLSNALKFSKKDVSPEIVITQKIVSEKSFSAKENSKGNFIVIKIKDNGIGFDLNHASVIFDLFGRLNSKDKYEGTGIGLAVVKKILEKHHGMIEVKSKEDVGTEFSILLPLTQNQ